uniref:Secreted protein n=1 Tax=Anopheles coluzzii TaxID=1518534 RepID=A0A8W7PXE7_ANOCL
MTEVRKGSLLSFCRWLGPFYCAFILLLACPPASSDCTSDLPVSDEPLSMYWWPLVAVDEAVTWIGRLPLRAFVESLMFISEMLHEFLPAVWRNPCAQMLIAQPTTICVSCSVVMSIAIERGGLKLRARSA